MAHHHSSLKKHYGQKPANTLSFLDFDEADLKSTTERERKTEKSVHFASLSESVSSGESDVDSLKTSRDVITWLPSEHLYSDDTFITETHTDGRTVTEATSPASPDIGTTIQTQPSYGSSTFVDLDSKDETRIQTQPSYGSSTFIDLDSEDETKTESDYSYSESLLSSAVFSPESKSDTTTTYREWKDVTEIVKDIEELEESEFVTRADSHYLRKDGVEETDVSESEDEELAAWARQNFLVNTIQRLRAGTSIHMSGRSEFDSSLGSLSSGRRQRRAMGPADKEKASFCKRMVEKLRTPKSDTPTTSAPAKTELHEKAEKRSKPHVLEHYGLNSALVDRLKIDNLEHRLNKKILDIEKDTEKSLEYVRTHQHIEDEFQRDQFLSQMKAHVQNEKSEERIQAHLIRMHPVKWFADFVNDLPNFDDDSKEILYKYKRQLERRQGEES